MSTVTKKESNAMIAVFVVIPMMLFYYSIIIAFCVRIFLFMMGD